MIFLTGLSKPESICEKEETKISKFSIFPAYPDRYTLELSLRLKFLFTLDENLSIS